MQKKSKSRNGNRIKRRLHTLVTGTGYTWLCDFGLCHWVNAYKSHLLNRGKPSPEARAVKVRIILESDWRKLNPKLTDHP